MSRGLDDVARRIGSIQLSPSRKAEAIAGYCRRAGIVARDASRTKGLALRSDITAAARFAAYDFEACDAGGNADHRECFLKQDLECLQSAAAALDKALFPYPGTRWNK